MKILVSPTKTMNPRQFGPDQLAFANETLKIFSGLYGVLRPMDGIKPYRLDFNTPLPRESKTLKLLGKLKNLSVRAKQARGLFASEIIQKKITNVNAIKKIALADYGYAKVLSSTAEWFFIR